MKYAEFKGINAFLVGMSKVLMTEAVERTVRGQECYEIPNPVMIKITNPCSRLVTISERKWNPILPFVESLWLASGRNDMGMVGHYVRKLFDFSDDQATMRAGYGPRFRFYNGIGDDYCTGYLQEHSRPSASNVVEIDQFEFVERCFLKDPQTRQAIISVGDPAKDCFEADHVLKQTKDFPCTRSLHFQRNGNMLDLIVHMRSNDFIWGASGVNIFNFTFIQEYFAGILGLDVGAYYHIADNFHYYSHKKDIVMALADVDIVNVSDDAEPVSKAFRGLSEFDERLRALQVYEQSLRVEQKKELLSFDDNFFDDWAKVFYVYNTKAERIKFSNPALEELLRRKPTRKAVAADKKLFADTFSPGKGEEDRQVISWREYI